MTQPPPGGTGPGDDDPMIDPPGDDPPGDDLSVDERQQSDCAGDARTQPMGERCSCKYNCDSSELTCQCDADCYSGAAADCAVTCMGSGDSFVCMSGDGEVGGIVGGCGTLTCQPESDLTKNLECTASDCTSAPENAVLTPPAPPQEGFIEANRTIGRTDVLVTIDTSGSMQDKQRNMACAIDSFAAQLSAEAEYSVGVVTQNTVCYENEMGQMSGEVPGLIGLADPACAQVACECVESEDVNIQCGFHKMGELVTEQTAGGLDLLKKTFVLGEFDDEDACPGDGNGDEANYTPIVLRALEAISQGRPAPAIGVTASDESADDDGDACLWIEANYADPNRNIYNTILRDFDPPPLSGDCHTDLINFYSYFFTTYGCDHDPDGDGVPNPEVPNANPGSPCTRIYSLCDPEACDIQQGVVAATGGIVWDINMCPYDDFFAEIGFSTSTLSTAICGIDTNDPSSLVVIYVDGSTNQTVPPLSMDGTNGWTYDATLGCIDFHGSWAAVEGRFRIEFGMSSVPPDPKVCFGPGIEPIVSSIVLRYLTVDGEIVPQSSTDGWTFDVATDCFDFHGHWADAPFVLGPFHVEYFDVNR